MAKIYFSLSRLAILCLLLMAFDALAIVSPPTPDPTARVASVRCRAGHEKTWIDWKWLPGATHYRVRRFEGESFVTLPTVTKTRIRDHGLSNGTLYRYDVVAILGSGEETQPSIACEIEAGSKPPGNKPPAFVSDPVLTARTSEPYVYHAQAIDPEGQSVGYRLRTSPAGMTIDSAGGEINWNPLSSQIGTFPVKIIASDPGGKSTWQKYFIVVSEGSAGPNLPPTITSTPPIEATVGETYDYDVEASDPDGDVVAFSLRVAPSGMTIDAGTGVIAWTPTASDIGLHPVTVRVSDPFDAFDEQDFEIDVSDPLNTPPVITSLPIVEAVSDVAYEYDVEASDAEGDILTFSLDLVPTGMTIDANSGQIDWTPTPLQVGPFDVRVRASDPGGLFDVQTFVVTVAPPANHAPLVQALLAPSARPPQRFGIFFGEDPNRTDDPTTPADEPVRPVSLPNAGAARDRFLRELTGDVHIETFEDLPTGPAPAVLTFGSETVEFRSDNGTILSVPTGTSGGRFPISGSKLLEDRTTAFAFSMVFANPIGAIGFFATDFADSPAFSGRLVLDLRHEDGGQSLVEVPHSPAPTVGSGSGSALYFGMITTDRPVAEITFRNAANGVVDAFGFDDIVIARPDQVRSGLFEGETAALAPALFSDVEPEQTHTEAVVWGGQPDPDSLLTEDAGAGTVASSRAFPDDVDTSVEVCVTDSEGATGCDATPVVVQNLPPRIECSVAGFRLVGVTPAGRLLEYDTLTGRETEIAETGFESWGGLDWHPQRGRLYGIVTHTTHPRLATLDPATGAVEIVGPILLDGVQVGFSEAMAFDPTTGALVAAVSIGATGGSPFDFAAELLVALDPDTAVATRIGLLGETSVVTSDLLPGQGDGDEIEFIGGQLVLSDGNGVAPFTASFVEVDRETGATRILREGAPNLGSMAYDDSTGILYVGEHIPQPGQTAALYRVDPSTGTATLVASNWVESTLAVIPPSVGTRVLAANRAGRLFEIDPATGSLGFFADTGISGWDSMTYHPLRGLLYGVTGVSLIASTAPTLTVVDPATGEARVVGPIALNGRQVGMAEGIAFDPVSQSLVVSVSVDTGPAQSDFLTETLVRVDPDTGIASDPIALGPTRESTPDADDLASFRGRLVALDANLTFASIFGVDEDGGTTELGRFDPTRMDAIAGTLDTGVLYGVSAGDSTTRGFYRLTPDTNSALRLSTFSEALGALAVVPGPLCEAGGLYAIDAEEHLLVYDVDTGRGRDLGEIQFATSGNVAPRGTSSLAFDPVRGALFATFSRSDFLIRIDPSTGTAFEVGPFALSTGGLTSAVCGLSWNREDGGLYAIYSLDVAQNPCDEIGLVDVSTGTITPRVTLSQASPRGDFGLRVDADAIEWIEGTLFVVDADGAETEATLVYEVDLSTGFADLVGQLGVTGEDVLLFGLAYAEPSGVLFGASSVSDRLVSANLDGFTFRDRFDFPSGVLDIAFAIPPTFQGATALAEGQASSLTLRFSDPGVLDTHTGTIDWGDGNFDAANAISSSGSGFVGGTHVYTQNGEFEARFCVQDDDGGEGCTALAVHVFNRPPEVTPVDDAAFNEGGLLEISTTFRDAGHFDTHTASIDWGDGSPEEPASLVQESGGGRITASHVYETRGSYSATLCVDDGSDLACINIEIRVNGAPSIVSAPPLVTVPGAAYAYPPSVDDDPGDTLSFFLDTAPAGMSIDSATGFISWTPLASQLGDQSIDLRVVDSSGLFDTQTFSVAVVLDTVPPTVSVTLSNPRIDPGDNSTLVVVASDNGAPPSVSVLVDGNPVTLDPSGEFVISPPGSGPILIVVTVTDDADNTTSETIALAVMDPTDTTPPIAILESPADLAEVTYLEDLIGTATDENFFRYQIGLARGSDGPFQLIAQGFGPVTSDVLGVLDPTLLENGVHRVRLVAEDVNGALAAAEHAVLVTGAAKVGALSLSFVDLAVSLAGIDLELVRSYDVRRRTTSDDFGFGWKLDLRAGSVTHNRIPGEGFILSQSGGFDFVCEITTETRSHLTQVTLSDHEYYVFKLGVSGTTAFGGGCEGEARFDTLGGSAPGATLTILSDRSVLSLGDDTLVDPDNLLAYSPNRVRLRTRDGREVDFDFEQGGVIRIADRNGNAITHSSSGLVHSSGTGIAFTRDAEGRITQVTDPTGGLLQYQYDTSGDLVRFSNQVADESRFAYDGGHRLVDYVDGTGNISQNQFDGSGRWLGTSDDSGRLQAFVYDLDNRIVTTTNALGEPLTREYDPDGNIVREVDANGSEWTYSYGDDGRKLSETDPLGATSTFIYNAAGDLEQQTDPLGNVIAYGRDANGRLTDLGFDNGDGEHFEYDGVGNLTLMRDADGNETRFAYDGRGLMTGTTHPDGRNETWEYDASGNLIRETDRDGAVTNHTYDAAGRRLSTEIEVATPLGPRTLRTQFSLDAAGRVASITDPEGQVTQIAHDADGRAISRTDAMARETQIAYEGSVPSLVVLPDGRSARTVYNEASRVEAFVSEDGVENRYAHDPAGRLVSVTQPDAATGAPGAGAARSFEYAATGLVSAISDPSGVRVELDHDAAGRPTVFRDALGNETQIDYDVRGREISRTDALARTTALELDGNGNQTAITYADGSVERYSYDARGNVLTHTDELGRITSFAYDGADRISAVTDADGGVTSYQRDAAGRLVEMTDALGRVTRFEVDGNGFETAIVRPLGQRLERSYDAVGRLVSTTDFASGVLNFEYDAGDRRVVRLGSDSSLSEYAYDATGRRVNFSDETGTTTFTYDELGRPATRTEPDGRELAWSYDTAGRVTGLTSPAGAQSFAYDVLARLASVRGPTGDLTSYAYDSAGQLVESVLPDGSIETRTYDLRGRILELERRSSGGTLISRFTYTYDAVGNTLSVDESPGLRVEWDYDALDRVTAERRFDSAVLTRSVAYTYDAVGNRLSLTDSATGVHTFVYDDNDRLVSETSPLGTTTYSYDANGQRTARNDSSVGTTTYAWDLDGRLREVAELFTGGSTFGYRYDPDGNRTAVIDDGNERLQLVDTNRRFSEVIDESATDGSLLANYVTGHQPISIEDGAGGFRVYGLDRHSGVRSLASLDGTLTDTYSYDAFGNLEDASGSFGNSRLYRGEFQNPLTGLTHLRAREFDSRTGTFVSPDPFAGLLDSPVSLHRYLYANGNPLRFVDPSGEFSLAELGLTAASIGILTSTAALAQLGLARSIGSISKDVPWDGSLASAGAGFLGDLGGGLIRTSSRCIPNTNASGTSKRVNAAYLLLLEGFGAGFEFAESEFSIQSPGVGRHSWLTLTGFANLIGVAIGESVGPRRFPQVPSTFSLSHMIAGIAYGDVGGQFRGVAASIGFVGGSSTPINFGEVIACPAQ